MVSGKMIFRTSDNADTKDKQPSQYTLQTVKSSSWPSIVKGIHAIKLSFVNQDNVNISYNDVDVCS